MLYQLSYAHHIALLLKLPDRQMAHPAGLEPATIRLEGGCSIQLSYGRLSIRLSRLTSFRLQPYRKGSAFAVSPSEWLFLRSGANVIDAPRTRQHKFSKKFSDIKELRENDGRRLCPREHPCENARPFFIPINGYPAQ